MKIIHYIFIILVFLFTNSLYAEDAKKEVDITKDLDKKYKIEREKDNLSCFIPLAIKDIDTVYLKNDKGQVVYTIEIWGSNGNCKWERDKIVFKDDLSMGESKFILKNYTPKIYYDGYLQIQFRVKKLLPKESINIKSIKIPYFVMIYDKKNDKEILKNNLEINISLPKEGEKIYVGDKVAIKESFLVNDFINLETLSGIYFKSIK